MWIAFWIVIFEAEHIPHSTSLPKLNHIRGNYIQNLAFHLRNLLEKYFRSKFEENYKLAISSWEVMCEKCDFMSFVFFFLSKLWSPHTLMRFNKTMSITAEQRMNYDATEIKLVFVSCVSERTQYICRLSVSSLSTIERRRQCDFKWNDAQIDTQYIDDDEPNVWLIDCTRCIDIIGLWFWNLVSIHTRAK